MSWLISELSIPAGPRFLGCDCHSWTVVIYVIIAFAALLRSAPRTRPGGDPGCFHRQDKDPWADKFPVLGKGCRGTQQTRTKI